ASISVIVLSFIANMTTQCMYIKKINRISTRNVTKIQPAASLGYREDGYLSNWLSFRTLEEAAQGLTSEYGHTQESARRFFMKQIKKKQNLALIAQLTEQNFTGPVKPLDLGQTKASCLELFVALAQQGHVH